MMNNTTVNTNASISMNDVIDGRVKSMRLDQIISNFINLFEMNDPRKDCEEKHGRDEHGHEFIQPEFKKDLWYSSQILRILQNKWKYLVISTVDGEEVLKTSDIDMMYFSLAFYNAWIEDHTSDGFVWFNSESSTGYVAKFE